MRRFVVIVSALLMSLTLTACGNSHSERAEDNISREYAATEPVSNIDADEETAVESTVITTAEEVTESEATEKSDTDTDILIAFFSRADENYNVGTIEKGNTQVLAEMIYDRVNSITLKLSLLILLIMIAALILQSRNKMIMHARNSVLQLRILITMT